MAPVSPGGGGGGARDGWLSLGAVFSTRQPTATPGYVGEGGGAVCPEGGRVRNCKAGGGGDTRARDGVRHRRTGWESVVRGPREMVGWGRCPWEGTFAGADHLEYHLGGSPVVQPRLLVQEPLLLHLFLLRQGRAHGAQ